MSDNAAAEVLYSYDGQGRLIEERQKYGNDSEQWERALLYTYEGDSLMPSTVVKVNIKRPWDAGDEKSYENIIRWQYTYKASGQPEGATIEVWENLGEIADPETEGKRTLELKLTYGDYYFYNAEEN
jgi:YD repeat-containing protein